jgi:cytochrome c peroxidase
MLGRALAVALVQLGLGFAVASAATAFPAYREIPDASGQVATYYHAVAGAEPGLFFRSFGANGRSCATCHQPGDGWSITPAHIKERFERSNGHDPLFRLVDGATCPSDDVSTPQAMRKAYSLLIDKGLIRMEEPIPSDSEFSVIHVDDPYGCTKLGSPRVGTLSVYRRPLPAANLRFETAIMWDGREPSLASQAMHAALQHEQASSAPPPQELKKVVAFESGLWTAQVWDDAVGSLQEGGANGGPMDLSRQDFYAGINDSVVGREFNFDVFNLYKKWRGLKGSARNDARAAVARGEAIFNQAPIVMGELSGIAPGEDSLTGFCSTCHDTPNVGNRSIDRLINIGTADALQRTPDLPLFTLRCDKGPLAGKIFRVSDPGRALVTGKCEDIGKFTVPSLRGLAARPPYFHDGSAATLMDVVNFYNTRFGIGLTERQKKDLVAFLKTL